MTLIEINKNTSHNNGFKKLGFSGLQIPNFLKSQNVSDNHPKSAKKQHYINYENKIHINK